MKRVCSIASMAVLSMVEPLGKVMLCEGAGVGASGAGVGCACVCGVVAFDEEDRVERKSLRGIGLRCV